MLQPQTHRRHLPPMQHQIVKRVRHWFIPQISSGRILVMKLPIPKGVDRRRGRRQSIQRILSSSSSNNSSRSSNNNIKSSNGNNNSSSCSNNSFMPRPTTKAKAKAKTITSKRSNNFLLNSRRFPAQRQSLRVAGEQLRLQRRPRQRRQRSLNSGREQQQRKGIQKATFSLQRVQLVPQRLNSKLRDRQRLSNRGRIRQLLRRRFLTSILDIASTSICYAYVQQHRRMPLNDSCKDLRRPYRRLITNHSATLSVLNVLVSYGTWRKRLELRRTSPIRDDKR